MKTNSQKAVIAVTGSSGAGKSQNTRDAVTHLTALGYLATELVSSTTRPKREREVDGISYHFEDSEFTPSIHAEIKKHGEFNYGIRRDELLKANENDISFFVIDATGAKELPHLMAKENINALMGSIQFGMSSTEDREEILARLVSGGFSRNSSEERVGREIKTFNVDAEKFIDKVGQDTISEMMGYLCDAGYLDKNEYIGRYLLYKRNLEDELRDTINSGLGHAKESELITLIAQQVNNSSFLYPDKLDNEAVSVAKSILNSPDNTFERHKKYELLKEISNPKDFIPIKIAIDIAHDKFSKNPHGNFSVLVSLSPNDIDDETSIYNTIHEKTYTGYTPSDQGRMRLDVERMILTAAAKEKMLGINIIPGEYTINMHPSRKALSEIIDEKTMIKLDGMLLSQDKMETKKYLEGETLYQGLSSNAPNYDKAISICHDLGFDVYQNNKNSSFFYSDGKNLGFISLLPTDGDESQLNICFCYDNSDGYDKASILETGEVLGIDGLSAEKLKAGLNRSSVAYADIAEECMYTSKADWSHRVEQSKCIEGKRADIAIQDIPLINPNHLTLKPGEE